MELRRKTLNECKGDKRLQKAVALWVLLKRKLGQSACLCNWSYNKLRQLTGCGASTLRKYLPVLAANGWVRFTGRNGRHLTVRATGSHHRERNVCLDGFDFGAFKDVFRSLEAYLAMRIQASKEFIKRAMQIATNPSRRDAPLFKRARRYVRRLVRDGLLPDVHSAFKEFGISLKRIAREIGTCARTAGRVMSYAARHRWLRRKRHVVRFDLPRIGTRSFIDAFSEPFTFVTSRYIYRVHANTYTLERQVLSDLRHIPRAGW